MRRKRPGRHDHSFDLDYPCPKCSTPLKGLTRLKLINGGLGAVLMPLLFPCVGCPITWGIADSPKQKGAVKVPGGFAIVPVDSGENN